MVIYIISKNTFMYASVRVCSCLCISGLVSVGLPRPPSDPCFINKVNKAVLSVGPHSRSEAAITGTASGNRPVCPVTFMFTYQFRQSQTMS